MNNRQNNRRRGRGGGGGNNPRPSGNNGSRIDNRARGNANQLYEKYKTLARDMQTQGDRVMTEYYLQFADHYYRVLAENRPRFEEQRRQREDAEEYGDEMDGHVAAAPRAAEAHAEIDEGEGEDAAPVRARRGRPMRQHDEEDQGRLEIDRLPPAFSAADDDGDDGRADDQDEEPKPRRRGRPRKSEAAAAE